MPDMFILVACAVAIFALAAFAQAVAGFGGAMVAVPLLLLVMDGRSAVVAATGVSLVISARAWRSDQGSVDGPSARRLAVAGVLSAPLGLLLLLAVDERVLGVSVGVVVLSTALLTAAGLRVPVTVPAQWGSGLLSGALLTSTGMNGPPLVFTLASTDLSAREVRATLQSVFTIQDAIALVLFGAAGLLSRDALCAMAAGCLGTPLGWALGDSIFGRLSESGFRRIVLGGLVVVGLTCLIG